mmetsp:Transcript_92723/g.299987  ORF Transcript_92723/g.299987 Transcript_92723/m.299987 type:complete len:94 (-) Transcript_92723:184-465(-)
MCMDVCSQRHTTAELMRRQQVILACAVIPSMLADLYYVCAAPPLDTLAHCCALLMGIATRRALSAADCLQQCRRSESGDETEYEIGASESDRG